MKASVIITAWGETPSELDRAIKGIELSADSVHETVLVINNYDADPARTRKIEEFARSNPEITRWALLSHNIGVARAWNLGAQMCEGEALIILNGDCVLGQGAVCALIEPFSNKFIGVVGVGGWREGVKTTAKGLTEGVFGYCFAVRRRAYEDAGGFDNNFSPLADEAEFCARVWDRGWGVYIAEGVDCKHEYNISEKPHEDIIYFGNKLDRRELDRKNFEYRQSLPWFTKIFHKK